MFLRGMSGIKLGRSALAKAYRDFCFRPGNSARAIANRFYPVADPLPVSASAIVISGGCG